MFLLVMLTLLAGCEKEYTQDLAVSESSITTDPYGSWPSPVSAASTVEGSRSMHSLAFDGGYLYWVESRPEEGGRSTIVRWKAGADLEELLPAPWDVRTRIHEYGGLAMLVANGVIWFTNYQDQRLYRMSPGSGPAAITPESGARYGACALDTQRDRLLCVREDHRPLGEPRNALVAVAQDGQFDEEVLYDGSDFVSAPSLSPDGKKLAFISWQHPNMPWDNTTLWTADVDETGSLSNLLEHNPNSRESVVDPQWGANNQLYVLSDRNNWWTLYTVEGEQFTRVDTGLDEVEIGGPAWGLGGHFYRLLPEGRIVAQVMRQGVEQLYLLDPRLGSAAPLGLDSAEIGEVLPAPGNLFVVNAPAGRPSELIVTDLAGQHSRVIRKASDASPGPEWVPDYQLVSFPSGGDTQAHGIYLPPTNPEVQAPTDGAPPLIVQVHGGPTGVATPSFSIAQQYWTSRGFAILNLNYRGSTGFGRDYRQALYGQWGIADVEDAVAGAQWLAGQGLADPKRLIITGGSAGGYTTLAAHAFHDTFAAGSSYFGVSDIEALAADTHKFESRYLDQLIGPYPERKDLYVERSPINHLDGFNAPLLLLQGLDDRVVPPDQSERIFEALKSRNVPTAYLPFEGEAHGFRKAENRIRALEAELYFYSRVLGFSPADELEPIEIIGLAPATE